LEYSYIMLLHYEMLDCGRLIKMIDVEKLTFLDGVLVTRHIFETVLQNHLTDKNGNSIRGICNGYLYSYLGAINDDVTGMLEDNVLNNSYFKIHGTFLYREFNRLSDKK